MSTNTNTNTNNFILHRIKNNNTLATSYFSMIIILAYFALHLFSFVFNLPYFGSINIFQLPIIFMNTFNEIWHLLVGQKRVLIFRELLSC